MLDIVITDLEANMVDSSVLPSLRGSSGTKRTHPWLSEHCLELVRAKVEASGTATEHATAVLCSQAKVDKHFQHTRHEE